MEVILIVPKGADMSLIELQYPCLLQEELDTDEETETYWCGNSEQCSGDGDDYMTYDECVDFCGLAESVIPGATTCIEGFGSWAMSMIRRKNFAGIVNGEEDWRETSDRYWKAFSRGKKILYEMSTSGDSCVSVQNESHLDQ